MTNEERAAKIRTFAELITAGTAPSIVQRAGLLARQKCRTPSLEELVEALTGVFDRDSDLFEKCLAERGP